MIITGIAARPMPGETVSGDAWIVRSEQSSALIAVIDGLGHGPHAHAAAQKAWGAIVAQPDQPLARLVEVAHRATEGTRGVVAGLLRLTFAERLLQYVGVGNIGIHVISPHTIRPISRNGTIGYRLPSLFEHRATYEYGDRFILFSDGLSMRLVETPLLRQGLDPQHLADQLLATYGKVTDDATVVVAETITPPPCAC